jgi:hypothetical protein
MPSIDANTRNRTDSYIRARQQHPAWQLLASRRAPLVLSCLQSLFETSQDGIGFDEALQSLAGMLSQHANDSELRSAPPNSPVSRGRNCAAGLEAT